MWLGFHNAHVSTNTIFPLWALLETPDLCDCVPVESWDITRDQRAILHQSISVQSHFHLHTRGHNCNLIEFHFISFTFSTKTFNSAAFSGLVTGEKKEAVIYKHYEYIQDSQAADTERCISLLFFFPISCLGWAFIQRNAVCLLSLWFENHARGYLFIFIRVTAARKKAEIPLKREAEAARPLVRLNRTSSQDMQIFLVMYGSVRKWRRLQRFYFTHP